MAIVIRRDLGDTSMPTGPRSSSRARIDGLDEVARVIRYHQDE
jgi:hypothetical protein